MKNVYQQIASLAPGLSLSELNQAMKLFKKLSDVKSGKQQSLNNEHAGMNRLDSLFHTNLTKYLLAATGKRPLQLEMLKSTNHSLFMQIVNVRETLDGHLEHWVSKKHRKNSQSKFYVLYCEVIGEYIINNTEAPLSLKTMVNMIDSFPGILDRAFPGYVNSGLLHLVFKDKK